MLVLAVDDDPEDRELFIEAVHDIDSSILVVTANDGEEAIKFLTQEVVVLPDFIFLDLNMPRIGGRKCLL